MLMMVLPSASFFANLIAEEQSKGHTMVQARLRVCSTEIEVTVGALEDVEAAPTQLG
jgi:hypothetical protein